MTRIGVFDSGVGGLSVLHEIRTLLPTVDCVYFADSGYCPYGTRSYAEIQARSRAITGFLLQRGAQIVVVACNTATAAAVDTLRETYRDVPIVGMEPAVKPAAAATRSGVVGVLATGATLGGERFAGLAERFAEGVELLTQACPGLVEQVEQGDLDGPVTRALLKEYVQPLLDRGADTLVLGCTHYPFLRETLRDLVGPEVAIVDAGAAVARQTARVLGLSPGFAGPSDAGVQFWTTDLRVARVLQSLWGERPEVQLADV